MGWKPLAADPHHSAARTARACVLAAVDGQRLLKGHCRRHALQVLELRALVRVGGRISRLRVLQGLRGDGIRVGGD